MQYDPPAFRAAFRAALVALLGSQNVGSGRPVDGGTFPFVSLRWDNDDQYTLKGDGKNLGAIVRHEFSLWETIESENGSLAKTLISGIDGVAMGGTRVRVVGRGRQEDPDREDLVHTVITFTTPVPF